MEKVVLMLLANGGPVGSVAAVLFILLVFALFLRQKGLLGGGEKSLVRKDDIASINKKLGDILSQGDDHKSRIAALEGDLKHRPTHREIHDLALSVAKLDGRINGIEKTTMATNGAVGRIEEHLLQSTGRRSK